MAFFRTLTASAAIAASLALSAVADAQSLTPGSPSILMTFELDGDNGKVAGTVTAPTTSSMWQELPADVRMDITVTRSCYALGENNVAIASFSGMAPGESVNFTDDAVPAWQYGYLYTYTPVASIDGVSGMQGYGQMEPGIKFGFPSNGVSARQVVTDDGKYEVEISVAVPTKTAEYPPKDLPMDMTALEFYRVSKNNDKILLGTIPNPTKGETYTFTDEHPAINAENGYAVKCVSNFGFAELNTYLFVGLDVPYAPYGVKAVPYDGGNKITWDAPTYGLNRGEIDPEDTFYTVYRCWGRSASEREQIASDLKTTEYVDYGTDLEEARLVGYQVQASNSQGAGGISEVYVFNLPIGPAAELPFIETFDGGTDNLWTYTYSTYSMQLGVATEGYYGLSENPIAPHSGTGLIYVNYRYANSTATNSMTSYNINVKEAGAAALSFWYYAIPGNGATVTVSIAKDGGEYTDALVQSMGTDAAAAHWSCAFLPLDGYADADVITIRFTTSSGGSLMGVALDDIQIVSYPPVGTINVEYDEDACSATLTWEDPSTEYARVVKYEGFVNGVSVGDVAMPWLFKAEDYMTPYSIAVKAVYDGIQAPLSEPVEVSVPRPPFTEFTIGDHTYAIVQDASLGSYQLTIKKYHGSTALYKAPEMVTYDDVTYIVVGIDAGAYSGNTDIVSLTIPGGISRIGEKAFEDCSELMAVGLGKDVRSIESRAFAGCSALSRVIFESEEVPEVADDAFEGIASGCQGECPEGMAGQYAAVIGLSPIDFGTLGISDILTDGASEIEYFDLKGNRVSYPTPGVVTVVRTIYPDGTTKAALVISRK